MNKIIRLIPDDFTGMYKTYGAKRSREMDKVLSNLYGFECINDTYNYHATDEAKLALFILKHPEFIENISYIKNVSYE